MVDDEVNDFLEHFGIKGMRWGHRKSNSSLDDVKPARTPEEIRKRRKRMALISIGALGTYAAVGAGLGFIASPQGNAMMSQAAKHINEKNAKKAANAGRIFVENAINVNSRIASPYVPATRLMLNRGS